MAGGNKDFSTDYSLIDRLLHRMAFAHPVIQKALSEIESDMFAARFADRDAARPVFVTGLPRAGTTLLLEALYKTGEFSTFTYREMPFLLAPLLWASMTRGGRKAGEARERAHGDGMEISFDSPEAFEEVLWISYLGDHYIKPDRLLPIGPKALSTEFREAFPTLIRKLSAVQSPGDGGRRYLSKNNANVARLGAIRSLFADATIFVCFRDPHSHVRSLMTQHERFSQLHAEDRFARDYMRWIGHFDFGANFRPIDFKKIDSKKTGAVASADTADFWLSYWIDAYSYVEAKAADISLVCYEETLSAPESAFERIAAKAGLKDPNGMIASARAIRQPTTAPDALDGVDPALASKAMALYERLRGLSRR